MELTSWYTERLSHRGPPILRTGLMSKGDHFLDDNTIKDLNINYIQRCARICCQSFGIRGGIPCEGPDPN